MRSLSLTLNVDHNQLKYNQQLFTEVEVASGGYAAK